MAYSVQIKPRKQHGHRFFGYLMFEVRPSTVDGVTRKHSPTAKNHLLAAVLSQPEVETEPDERQAAFVVTLEARPALPLIKTVREDSGSA